MQKLSLILAIICISASAAFAQPTSISGQDPNSRAITTAVPFMMIAPDARSGAMGDAGAAISPDANSMHWNIGKLAFIESDYGGSVSYTPWLGKIFNDMHIAYLSGYFKIDENQVVSSSLRYFNLGNITFTDDNGLIIRPYNPQEFAFDLSYSRKLSQKLGIGVTGRYIHSNLAGDGAAMNLDTRPGQSVAADVGVFYNTSADGINQGDGLALAAVVSNIGNKINYLSATEEYFIPTNLRLGSAYTHQLDPYNKITIALDFNKLMVPTPHGSLYTENENGGIDDPSLLRGWFGSFADAPDGFSEELKEITINAGAEYWYNELFAVRAGYFHEHANKGGRKYFTFGVGLRYQIFNMDFAYLVPQEQQHPLAETLRFTLGINFERPPQATSMNN